MSSQMRDGGRVMSHDLGKLIGTFREGPRGPVLDRCGCSSCGWVGDPRICGHYTDHESWEMPHIKWEVYICPVCGEEDIEDFWSSSDEPKRNRPRKQTNQPPRGKRRKATRSEG